MGKQFLSCISVAEGGGKAVLTLHANLIMISVMSCKFGEGIFGHQHTVELYCYLLKLQCVINGGCAWCQIHHLTVNYFVGKVKCYHRKACHAGLPFSNLL